MFTVKISFPISGNLKQQIFDYFANSPAIDLFKWEESEDGENDIIYLYSNEDTIRKSILSSNTLITCLAAKLFNELEFLQVFSGCTRYQTLTIKQICSGIRIADFCLEFVDTNFKVEYLLPSQNN